MYRYLLLSSLLLLSLDAKPVKSAAELQAVDANTKVEVPLYYADYKWYVGIVGGLTYDGVQVDAKRMSLGLGLNAGYHITSGFTVQGEYADYFKTYADDKANENIRTQIAALNVAYDFTPEKSYGLFVKAGIGYEHLDIYRENQKHPVSLIGLGLRFKVANHISTYIQTRWRMRLTNMSEPDNGLIAAWGFDYHFGLTDKKNHLIEMVNEHNALVKSGQ